MSSTAGQAESSSSAADELPRDEPLDERSELVDSIQLVHAAQDGDMRALERFFARYYLRVLSQVRHRLGPGLRRDLDSQDVAQEAMVEAIRDFKGFDIQSRAGLIGLFATIVENRLRTNAKRQHAIQRDRDQQVALRFIQDALQSGSLTLDPADDGPEPPELAERREGERLLEECLETLDEGARRIVQLREYQELSWAEVAREIGATSAGAARMMHARVMVRLKREMDRRRSG